MTEPVSLEMVPLRTRPGHFTAVLPCGRVLVRSSRQPLFDGARALTAEGVATETVITTRHRGSTIVAMRSSVGEAAKWTIEGSIAADCGSGSGRRFIRVVLPGDGVPETHGRLLAWRNGPPALRSALLRLLPPNSPWKSPDGEKGSHRAASKTAQVPAASANALTIRMLMPVPRSDATGHNRITLTTDHQKPATSPTGEEDALKPSRRRNPEFAGVQATARWRERRRQGSLVVPVELFEHEVAVLVQVGLLPRAQAHDRGSIGRVIEGMIDRFVTRRKGNSR